MDWIRETVCSSILFSQFTSGRNQHFSSASTSCFLFDTSDTPVLPCTQRYCAVAHGPTASSPSSSDRQRCNVRSPARHSSHSGVPPQDPSPPESSDMTSSLFVRLEPGEFGSHD